MRRVTPSETQDLANLFLQGNLIHPIEMSVAAVRFSVSDIEEPGLESDGWMHARVMTGPDGVGAVQVSVHTGWLNLRVGRWSDQPDNQQVVLSSNREELDPRFGQINLNLSLTDGRTVYLVKNLSKEGGSGSIRRLYGGASGPEMLQERERRRDRLVAALDTEMLTFDEEDWLVVAALPLRAPRHRTDALFTEVLVQILRYAAQVERLRQGAAEEFEIEIEEETQQTVGAPRRLSAAERKRIELEVMAVVRAHLEDQNYRPAPGWSN